MILSTNMYNNVHYLKKHRITVTIVTGFVPKNRATASELKHSLAKYCERILGYIDTHDKLAVESSARIVQSESKIADCKGMDSSTAPSATSLTSRIWHTTVGKCFSVCRLEEEPESIAVVLLKGELREAKKAVEELKGCLAEQDASFKICKREIKEAQIEIHDAIQQSRAFQNRIERQSLKLEKLKEVYGNAVKQFEAKEEASKQGMIEAESKMVETCNQKKALQNTVGEQEHTIERLTRANEDLGNRYREIIENPCTCFFVRHVEEYLYDRYEADGNDIPTIDENLSSSQLEARVIVDTDGFVPTENFQIQLSDYEYSDLTLDSDEYSESTSSDDTSDLDVRYINSDVSKATSKSNESTPQEEKSSPGQSTSAPFVEEEGEKEEEEEMDDEEKKDGEKENEKKEYDEKEGGEEEDEKKEEEVKDDEEKETEEEDEQKEYGAKKDEEEEHELDFHWPSDYF